MEIPVHVPGLLADSVGGSRCIRIEADRLDEALHALLERFPRLAPHVWDEAGKPRQHVLVYLNDESILWIDDLARPLKHGDELHIIQAVSGG